MEKIKQNFFENKKLIIGLLIWVWIAWTLTYASGQWLIWELFYINSNNKLSMSWSIAFEDRTIPTSKLKWKLELSQLPDGIWTDAKTLSWRTVSSTLDTSDAKIPTNKAVMDKIAWLLNCAANADFDWYDLPFTNVWQETPLKSKRVDVAAWYNWSLTAWEYTLTQKFKCEMWSFVPVLTTPTKTNIKCYVWSNIVWWYTTTQLTGWTQQDFHRTQAWTNWTVTYKKTFTCSNDAILTSSSESYVEITCNPWYNKTASTVCEPAWQNCNTDYLKQWSACYIKCWKWSTWDNCLLVAEWGVLKQVTTTLVTTATDYSAWIAWSSNHCGWQSYGWVTSWKTPNRTELGSLYTHRASIWNFSSTYYWSSEANDYDDARCRNFSNGSGTTSFKGDTSRVRCVRSI